MHTLLVWLLPLLAAPASEGVPPVPPTPELPSYGGLLLRTLLALVVVLVIAWILLRWGLRRLLPGGATPGPLEVLGRVPLDGRRAVVLVRAAGRYLVLGVGEGSVSLLVELEPEAVEEALRARAARSPKSFAEVLRDRLARKPAPSGADAAPGEKSDERPRGEAPRPDSRDPAEEPRHE